MEVKQGKSYVCTSSEFSTFTKGRVYTAPRDGYLVNDKGILYIIDDVFIDHFEPVQPSKVNELEPILKSVPTDAERFEALAHKMCETFKAKNHDYGNSFDKSLDKRGLVAAIVRMEDKMNRFDSLIDKDAQVKDESIRDTLLDLANYCIMTVMWLDKQK